MPLSHVLRAFSVDSLSIKFIPSYVNFFAYSYSPWGSHGKYTGVVCHSLLQWIMFFITFFVAEDGKAV